MGCVTTGQLDGPTYLEVRKSKAIVRGRRKWTYLGADRLHTVILPDRAHYYNPVY